MHPIGRYFHSAAFVASQRMMYMYGGFTDNSEQKVLGDFWMFSVINRNWSPVEHTGISPPPLAGHTLTNHGDLGLVLIGGFNMQYGLLEKIYEYNLTSRQWIVLNVTGAFPSGLLLTT